MVASRVNIMSGTRGVPNVVSRAPTPCSGESCEILFPSLLVAHGLHQQGRTVAPVGLAVTVGVLQDVAEDEPLAVGRDHAPSHTLDKHFAYRARLRLDAA
jgi:hypothetical protein